MEAPEINRNEFQRRRQQLLQQLALNSIVILPSGREITRNNDNVYPFRQHSDFYYLTGFEEPSSVLVMMSGAGNGNTILFCRDKDPQIEIWQGTVVGPDAAVTDYAVDLAFSINLLKPKLSQWLKKCNKVYYSLGRDDNFDQLMLDLINQIRQSARRGQNPPLEIIDLELLVHEMRLFKSKQEQAMMRYSAQVAGHALRQAMARCRPGMREYELEAELMKYFMRFGCREPAYTPIVAGGANACILHYIRNDKVLNDGELVLIDAGCEYKYYASDITRTFPINGRFSEDQKQLYEVVLHAHDEVIAAVKPGVCYDRLQKLTIRLLTEGFVALGILQGDVNDLIKAKAYQRFYMHNVSHWLGMDVHDVGQYKQNDDWRSLVAGMVLTIEPGVYISERHEDVDERWHNIGIRIEDDVLVTEQGCEILSDHVPRTIAEIEEWMASTK